MAFTQHFQLPTQSIPMTKMKIPEAHLKQFMIKNNIYSSDIDPKQNEKRAKQFSGLFNNVKVESASTIASNSQKEQSQIFNIKPLLTKIRMHVPQHKGYLFEQINSNPKNRETRVHSQEVRKRKTQSRSFQRRIIQTAETSLQNQLTPQNEYDQLIKKRSFSYFQIEKKEQQYKQQFEQAQQNEIQFFSQQQDKSMQSHQQEQTFDEPNIKLYLTSDKQEISFDQKHLFNLQIQGDKIHSPSQYNIKRYLSQKRKKQIQDEQMDEEKKKKIDITKIQRKVENDLEKYAIITDQKTKIQDLYLQEQQQIAFNQEQQFKAKQNFMFIQDDRDRFGKQLYPISEYINIPGPGYYEINPLSIENRQIKLLQRIDQQKMINQWSKKQQPGQ